MEGNVDRVGSGPASTLPGLVICLFMLFVLTVPASAFQARVINLDADRNSSRQPATLTIFGAVARPGCYAASDSKPTLAQLMEQAGGPLPEAGRKVRIIRGGRAGLVLMIPEQLNLPLHLGDVVLVESAGLAPARSVSHEQEQTPGPQAGTHVDNRVVRAAGYQAQQIARRGHVVLLGVRETPVVMPLWTAGLTKERLLTEYLHQDPAVAEQTRLLAGNYPTNRPGELRDGMVLGVPARLVNREMLPRLPEVIPVSAAQDATTQPPAVDAVSPPQPFQSRGLPTENRQQLPPGVQTPQTSSASPADISGIKSTAVEPAPAAGTAGESISENTAPITAGSSLPGGLHLPEQGTELMLIPRKPSSRGAGSVLVDRQTDPLPGDQRLAQREDQASGERPPSLREFLSESRPAERPHTEQPVEGPSTRSSAAVSETIQEIGEATRPGQNQPAEPSASAANQQAQPPKGESSSRTPFEAMFEQTWLEMSDQKSTAGATSKPLAEEHKLEELLEERRGEILHLAQAHEVIPPPREVPANPRGSLLPYFAGGMVLAAMIFVVLSILRSPSHRAEFTLLIRTASDRLQDWIAQSTDRWRERQSYHSATTRQDYSTWQQPQPPINDRNPLEANQSTPVEPILADREFPSAPQKPTQALRETFIADTPLASPTAGIAQAKTVGQMLEEFADSPADSSPLVSARQSENATLSELGQPRETSDESSLLELPMIEERVDLPRELRFFGKPQLHYEFRVDAAHAIARPHVLPRSVAAHTSFDEIIDRCREVPVALGAGAQHNESQQPLVQTTHKPKRSLRDSAASQAQPQVETASDTAASEISPAGKSLLTGTEHPGGLFSAAYALRAAELRGENELTRTDVS